MSAARFVAYYRVFTDKQGRSGSGLEAQRAAVEAHVAGARGAVVAEFVEVESRCKKDRPPLAAALATARAHRAVLVIAKLYRLARNIHFVSGLMESGAEFVAAGGGATTRLPGRLPVAEAFRTLPISQAALEFLKALLQALVSADVTLPGASLTGIILNVTATQARLPDTTVITRHALTLATASGIASVVLEDQPEGRPEPPGRGGRVGPGARARQPAQHGAEPGAAETRRRDAGEPGGRAGDVAGATSLGAGGARCLGRGAAGLFGRPRF